MNYVKILIILASVIQSLSLYSAEAQDDPDNKASGFMRKLSIFNKSSSSSLGSPSTPSSPRAVNDWQLKLSFIPDGEQSQFKGHEKIIMLHGIPFQLNAHDKTITAYPKGTFFDPRQITQEVLDEDHQYTSSDNSFDAFLQKKSDLEGLTPVIIRAVLAQAIRTHTRRIADLKEQLKEEQRDLGDVLKFLNKSGVQLPLDKKLDYGNKDDVLAQEKRLLTEGIHDLTKALVKLKLL